MRVIAGKYKGKDLYFPKNIRPSSQLHKKIVFDTIRPFIHDSIFLDLYSGSGQIGIEALSQEAHHATFVELGKSNYQAIKNNLELCQAPASSFLVVNSTVASFLNGHESKYDIIYADPPYHDVKWSDFDNIHKLLNKESIFILKYSPKNPPPDLPHLEIIRTKDSKDTNLNFYQSSL